MLRRGGETLDASKIRKRIFAISAVSGSAPGAAMGVAAFARAGTETKQPCANRTPKLWYGEKINNWRDCLEALMAGDFLTPTMIGLTFHDTIRFGWWRDRAALLERSWELRFANVMRIRRGNWQRRMSRRHAVPIHGPAAARWTVAAFAPGQWCIGGDWSAIDDDGAGFELHVRAIVVQPRPPGGRVRLEGKVARSKQTTYVTEHPGQKCPIFLEATAFHTLLTNNTDVDFWARIQRYFLWEYIREKFSFIFQKQNLDDVRLSTAATNSARFPVISPPGAVRNTKHNVVDRIVDGGYIENYGAITAMELAVAINAVRPEIVPFVLVISNDPDENPDLNQIDVPDAVFLTDVSIPLEAIASTRMGRGRLAVLQLNATLGQLNDPSCRRANTAHIRVWPQYVRRETARRRSHGRSR